MEESRSQRVAFPPVSRPLVGQSPRETPTSGDNSSDGGWGLRRTQPTPRSLCHILDFVQCTEIIQQTPRTLEGKTCPGLRQMGACEPCPLQRRPGFLQRVSHSLTLRGLFLTPAYRSAGGLPGTPAGSRAISASVLFPWAQTSIQF